MSLFDFWKIPDTPSLFRQKETKEVYLVEIIYKNGQRVSMWCSDLEIKQSDLSGHVTYLRLKKEYSDKYPDARYGGTGALHVGISDISSIWKVGSMKVKV